jgi:hypothetical protein
MTDVPIDENGPGGIVQHEASTLDANSRKVPHVMLTDSAGVSIAMRGPVTDHSATQASGAVTVAASDAARSFLLFQNISDTAMQIDFGVSAASAGGSSIYVPGISSVAGSAASGLRFEGPGFVPSGSISVFCAASGKKFILKTG